MGALLPKARSLAEGYTYVCCAGVVRQRMAGENEDAVLVVGLSEHREVLGSLPKTCNLDVLLPS